METKKINPQDLDDKINEFGGKHNIVFKVEKDLYHFKKGDILLMVDRDEHQKYKKDYKIYLTSTKLHSDSFYVSDFCSMINEGIFTPHYKFDLINYE